MSLRSLLLLFLALAAGMTVYAQSQGRGGSSLPYGMEQSESGRDIQLYPNPAPEYVHIKLGNLKSGDVELSVHNIIGNQMKPEVETIDDHEMRVRVKDMAPGYYFLSVKDNHSNFRGIYKFLKP